MHGITCLVGEMERWLCLECKPRRQGQIFAPEVQQAPMPSTLP